MVEVACAVSLHARAYKSARVPYTLLRSSVPKDICGVYGCVCACVTPVCVCDVHACEYLCAMRCWFAGDDSSFYLSSGPGLVWPENKEG